MSNPAGPVELIEVDHLRRVADGAAVVVIDSVPEAIAQGGLDENAASDVTRWIDGLPRPLARDGAAVLLVDHVVKAAAGRGRWARGSGAKLAAVDVAFELRSVRSFSRQGSGAARLVVAKDREGCVGAVGDVAAEVAFDVRLGGDEVQIRLDPPKAGGGERPLTDPHWVAERCREDGGWRSFADAVAALGIQERSGREVLRRAVTAGLLEEGRGPGAARRYQPAADAESMDSEDHDW
jgi:hypothetical protein